MAITLEEARFDYGSLAAPTNAEVRAQLREWQKTNRWDWGMLATAMRAWGLSAVPGGERLERFCRSATQTMNEDSLCSIRRFVRAFPRAGDADALLAEFDADRAEAARAKRERQRMQPVLREQERESYRRHWLAQELPADGRPAPRRRLAHNPFLGLDKATIHALSGGTL